MTYLNSTHISVLVLRTIRLLLGTGMEKRATNLTAADRQLIVELVEKYKDVPENKKTDTVANKEKEVTWKDKETDYNAVSQTQTSSRIFYGHSAGQLNFFVADS